MGENMTGTGLAERQVDTLADRLSRCYASAVHDVLRGLGHHNCLLPHEIRPPLPAHGVLAGEIWTAGRHINPTRSAHEPLLAWTGVLANAAAGPVVLCQPENPQHQ